MPIKILDIAWYKFLPARFGGQKGIEGFVSALSESFEVLVLCSKNNQATGNEPYKILPLLPVSQWQFIDKDNWRLIKKICIEEQITHICIEHPYYAWAAFYVKRFLKLPLIIHSHNIEAQRFKSLGKWWWKIMDWYEGKAYRNAELNLFKTSTDRAYAIAHYGVPEYKCVVLPYCLPQNHRAINKQQAAATIRLRYQIPATNKLLVFNGTLDYLPNAKGVKRIYENIAPLLLQESAVPFTIIICGRNELAAFNYLKYLSHPSVHQIGIVENVEELVAAADVFVNPVIEGGGIKTKIIDALGQHTTVVSFAAGAAGIEQDCTAKKLLVSGDEDYSQFVAFIIMAMEDSSLTPMSFFKAFNWKEHIGKLAEKYFEV